MSTKLQEEAKKVIESTYFLTLATVTAEGNPWNTPIYYSFDQDYNFYWMSADQSQHSKNIQNNNQVFIAIYSAAETGGGVYIQAEAEEIVEVNVLEKAIDLYSREIYTLPQQNPADFLFPSPLRMYRASPKKIWVSTPETAEKFHDLWIDHRVEIKLSK